MIGEKELPQRHPSEEHLTEILRGKTMKIYFRMLRSGRPWAARELQRELNLSSPSLSLYHLEKLQKSSLVEINSDGLYEISKVVRVGILKYYIKLGNQLIPRFVFYGSFFAFILIFTFIYYGFTLHPIDIILVFVLIACFIIFSYEAAYIIRYGFE